MGPIVLSLFCVVEVNMASTTIDITWAQVQNDVLITWNRISNQCIDNDESLSLENQSLSNNKSFVITGLKEFTEYNISVCINDSICDFSIVTTDQAGMWFIRYLLFIFMLDHFQPLLRLQKKSRWKEDLQQVLPSHGILYLVMIVMEISLAT